MKKTSVVLILLSLCLTEKSYSRLFFIGSNPSMSKTAFPQDILNIRRSFISYSFSWQNMPWWGDVNNPTGKPNSSYSSSSEDITFARQPGETRTSHFSRKGAINIFQNSVDFMHNWRKNTRSYYTLLAKNMVMRSSASGLLRATDDPDNYQYVDFSHRSSSDPWLLYMEKIFAHRLGSLPLGLKIGFGYESTPAPKSTLSATAHGRTVHSDRILWGWSTSGCNKIFGYSHINGDAWYLNSWSKGNLFQVDVQGGVTLPKAKVAARYRYREGIYDTWSWKSDQQAGDDASSAEKFISNFSGRYEKKKWADKTVEHIGRIYSNVTFKKLPMAKINTLFFFAADIYRESDVLAENNSIDRNYTDGFNNFIAEVNPNVNIFLGRGVIIDFGVLLEYSWTKFENTYKRWVSSAGGYRTAYRSSSVRVGDEPSWENFSYAREQFIDVGWELNLQFPFFKIGKHLLAAGVVLFQNFKYSWTEKVYGYNSDNGNGNLFTVTGKRNSYKQELWFNSSFSLFYKHERWFFRLVFIEPLVYLRGLGTKVTDGNGAILYEKNSKMERTVMEGGTVSRQPAGGESQRLIFSVGYYL